MHALDPRSWRDWGGPSHGGSSQGDPNREWALHLALIVAACLCLASFFPLPLVPLVTAGLLHSAAIGMVLLAIFEEDGVWAPTLTRWDPAAACVLFSFLFRLLAPGNAALPALQP